MKDFREGNMLNVAQLQKDLAAGNAAIGIPFMIRPQDWVNNEIPFDTMFPSTQFDITLELPDNATPEEKKAFEECRLEGSRINNTVKIGKDGKKPDINIPIMVIVQVSQMAKIQQKIAKENIDKNELDQYMANEKRIKEELGRVSMLNPGIPGGGNGPTPSIILPR